MTDYDYYLPDEPKCCPRCRGPLASWHGWDGPCRFVTWVQGENCARDPNGEAEVISPDQLAYLQLPDEFEAHTWCLHCWLGLVGRGVRKGNRWADWILTDDRGEVVDALPVDLGKRRCSNCWGAFEERETVPYRTCPKCDRLTRLVASRG
ncbi:MAG TPA: hypothetical protein VHL54_05715 [Actinomycetota bacterium]|nr:hypothetical protein [Actinomycetota bacterium]